MREIPLANSDKVVLVDDADYKRLAAEDWVLTKSGYAQSMDRPRVLMHRHIMRPIKEGITVDHINRNRLDNRKSVNLRFATYSEQRRNTKKRRDCTSKYKGVRRSKSGSWIASIKPPNSKQVRLGTFDDEVEAAKAYNKAAKKHFGEFANLNVF